MKFAIPALILILAASAGCQRSATPAAAPAAAPATSTPAAAAATPISGHVATTTTKRGKPAPASAGLFGGMVFPMAKSDFITQLNRRLSENCSRPDRHGRLCSKLEQRSPPCAAAIKQATITDADSARRAGHRYLRCMHNGHV